MQQMLGVLQKSKWAWFGLMFLANACTDFVTVILVICRFHPLPGMQNRNLLSEYPHILIYQDTTEMHFCYHLFNLVDLLQKKKKKKSWMYIFCHTRFELCANITWCRPHKRQLMWSPVNGNSYEAVANYLVLTT